MQMVYEAHTTNLASFARCNLIGSSATRPGQARPGFGELSQFRETGAIRRILLVEVDAILGHM